MDLANAILYNAKIPQVSADQLQSPGQTSIAQQILSQRPIVQMSQGAPSAQMQFNPSFNDVGQSALQSQMAMLRPDVFKAITPQEMAMQRAASMGQIQDLQAKMLANQMAIPKAQSEMGLQGAQANYYNNALQRGIAEKQFEYSNNPEMAQAAAMAKMLQGFTNPSSQPAMQQSPQFPPSSPYQPQNQPQMSGFSVPGTMIGKMVGLPPGMQLSPNTGQPEMIPGYTKMENGEVTTFGANGVPTRVIPKNPVAAASIENNINQLSKNLDELKSIGAAVDEGQPYLKNQKNAMLSSVWAQPFESGTKAQTIRAEMASYIMQAMPDYMQAKGITPGMERAASGQEMILKAIGIDPKSSIQSNKAVLANLSKIAGTGAYANKYLGEQQPLSLLSAPGATHTYNPATGQLEGLQ